MRAAACCASWASRCRSSASRPCSWSGTQCKSTSLRSQAHSSPGYSQRPSPLWRVRFLRGNSRPARRLASLLGRAAQATDRCSRGVQCILQDRCKGSARNARASASSALRVQILHPKHLWRCARRFQSACNPMIPLPRRPSHSDRRRSMTRRSSIERTQWRVGTVRRWAWNGGAGGRGTLQTTSSSRASTSSTRARLARTLPCCPPPLQRAKT